MGIADSLSIDFLVTALVVVLAPGTGVIYTLSIGVFQGARASVAAAFGCTLGIVPHLLASVLGLAALLHASAIAFQTVKLLGVAYLLYLAWGLWRAPSTIVLKKPESHAPPPPGLPGSHFAAIVFRGVAINILNPKLSIFFLAFLPQFVPTGASHALARISLLSAVFMAMTFVVFVGYGIAASGVRRRVLSSERLTKWLQRIFAGVFAAFAAKLALTEK